MSDLSVVIGNLVELSAELRNAGGALADPTTLSFRYRRPDGLVTTLVYGVDGALVRDSVGVFHVDLVVTNFPGMWTWRWWSTGDPTKAVEGEFTAPASLLA